MDIPSGCRVLVIDDMVEMEELIGILLAHERKDHVMYAHDGREGLAIAEREHPQLIILDLMMPDLHGYEVCRRLKAARALKEIPILLLTVVPAHIVYPEARQLGVAGYICKPFELDELLAARDALLRGEAYYPPLPQNHKTAPGSST